MSNELPRFTPGEPGHAARLNLVVDALTDALKRIEELESAKVPEVVEPVEVPEVVEAVPAKAPAKTRTPKAAAKPE